MVRTLISWSLHNRFIVLLGTVGLIAFGIHAAYNLNVEAYPDPTPPLVEVITQNPGASPEEMERLIGIPIETVLNGMPGLKYLRSISLAGLNDVKCQFEYGTDYWAARQEVINRIGAVSNLPAGVTPALSPWSPTGEIVRYVLEGPGYTLNQLKAVQDWVLERKLREVSGVIDVTGFGGTVKQYQVLLDTQLMKRFDVTLQMVTDAIAQSNANVGGDILPLGPQSHNVRAIGYLGEGLDPLDPAHADRSYAIEVEKLEDLQDVVVTTHSNMPVYIRQIAKVVIGYQPRLGVVGREGENDVVEGIVLMRKYEKSLPTSNKVQEKIDELNNGSLLPKGMRIVPFNRRTDLVYVTTHNVLHNMVVGMLLVVVILFVFLGDFTSAGIVALIIPLAILFSVSVLYIQGKSANLLSIGAVDFGIIVDSSVIIVENIYRHITARDADRSRPLIDRIADASVEIERALFFSTLIIVCAFIPLFSMTGPEGALFGPMANTYAFAIFGALILAVTLTPVLCSFLFHHKAEESDTFVDRAMKIRYLRMLDRVLRYRYLVLLIMGGLLAFTMYLVPRLGGEFMPPLEEGNLWIRALLPRTVTLQEAARMAPRLRKVIASVPEIRAVMSHVGRPDDGTDVTSYFNLEFNAPLIPMEEWRKKPAMFLGHRLWDRTITREEIQDELTSKFEAFPSVNFNFSQLIRDNVEEALSGVKGANSIKLFGSDLNVLETEGQRVVNVLNTIPGIKNAGLFHIIGQPNLEIQIDRRECARYGINVSDVEAVVQVAVGGRAFTQMVEGEKRFDIVLRLPRDQRDDPEVIGRIPVDTPGPDGKPGARIPLDQLVKIDPHKPGAAYIYRENNRRYIPIKFSVQGRDLASTISEAQRKVADPREGAYLSRGYDIVWSGEFAQMEQANARLLWIVPLSIGLIMVLLYVAFQSLKDAILVMANVVAATMGGVWALKLTGTPFSISAAVGFISIFGVAVQDGVLLISYFNQMRGAGLPVREAVMRGAELRVRPVVMTSLTAALGLLPAALANSIGSQAQKPLAIVVVGGMLVTLFLTRYLMPVLYSFFPAPAGNSECGDELIEGSHYTDQYFEPRTHRDRTEEHKDGPIPDSTAGDLDRDGSDQGERRIMRVHWKLILIVVLLAGIAGWLAIDHRRRGRLVEVWNQLSGSGAHAGEPRPSKAWAEAPTGSTSEAPLNVLSLGPDQIEAIGLRTFSVKAQTEPIILRLQGMTDYDQSTLTIVRPQFDSRVDKVLAELGSVVKKGDALLELFSTDLADAKSGYETALSQHSRDKKMLDARAPLAQSTAIPGKELIEMENDEAKSRLQMKLAKDKLLVYGLTPKEIEDVRNEDGVQKARMTLRSRADGIVIKRSAVQGNYYDSKDELMEIAPLDHLKVWATVSELDADKVELGQKIRIIFPFSDQEVEAAVEYIDKAIDPETRAARFRATVSNPEKRFKARMFVRVLLEIPPKQGHTVIPRGAMVSVDRLDFVFVKLAGSGRFERRNILLNKETSDWVIVEVPSKDNIGLKPGEEVVTNGSLILEQMYEDRLTLQGELSTERPRDDEVFGTVDKPTFISNH